MADPLQKGIQIVQQAVQQDAANNYLEAIRLYRMALDHFQTALSVELDPSRKALIQTKMAEYSDRMKKIREALTSAQSTPKPAPAPSPAPAPAPAPSPVGTPSLGPYAAIPVGNFAPPSATAVGGLPTQPAVVPGMMGPGAGAGVGGVSPLSSLAGNFTTPALPLSASAPGFSPSPLPTQGSLGQIPLSSIPTTGTPSLPSQSSTGQITPSYLAQLGASGSSGNLNSSNPYAAFGSGGMSSGTGMTSTTQPAASSSAPFNPYANFGQPSIPSSAANPYANLGSAPSGIPSSSSSSSSVSPTSSIGSGPGSIPSANPSLSQLPGSIAGLGIGATGPVGGGSTSNLHHLPGAVALPGMHQPVPQHTSAPSGGSFSAPEPTPAPTMPAVNPALLLGAGGPPKPLHNALVSTAIQHPRSQCNLKAAMYLAEVAQQEDQQRNYQEALDLYTEVLERFLLISENESNPMFKQTYRDQMEVYMRRAEQIKTSLQIAPNRVVESAIQAAARKPDPPSPLVDLSPSQGPPPARPMSAKPVLTHQGSSSGSSSHDHLVSNAPPPSRRNPLYDDVGPQSNMNFFGNHDEPFDPAPFTGRIIQIANETKSVLARQRLKLAVCLQNNLIRPGENIKIHVKVENRSTMVVNFLKLTLRRIERTRKFDSKGREVMAVDAIKVHRQEFYQGSMFPLPAEANYTGELLYQVPSGLRATNMFQRGIFEREYDMCIECDLSMRKNLKVRFEVIIDRV